MNQTNKVNCGLHFHPISYKGDVKGQRNTFLSLSYTFPWCPIKGMLKDFGTLLSVFIKKCVFICSSMAPKIPTYLVGIFHLKTKLFFRFLNHMRILLYISTELKNNVILIDKIFYCRRKQLVQYIIIFFLQMICLLNWSKESNDVSFRRSYCCCAYT